MSPEHEIVAWLSVLSLQQRARALTIMCSSLTVSARGLFLPEVTRGNEAAVIKYLKGVNELQHTLTNQISSYLGDESPYSLEGLNDMLVDVATNFGVEVFLSTAVEFARTRNQ